MSGNLVGVFIAFLLPFWLNSVGTFKSPAGGYMDFVVVTAWGSLGKFCCVLLYGMCLCLILSYVYCRSFVVCHGGLRDES